MNEADGPSEVMKLAVQLTRVGLSAASFGLTTEPRTVGGTIPGRPDPSNEPKIGLVAV